MAKYMKKLDRGIEKPSSFLSKKNSVAVPNLSRISSSLLDKDFDVPEIVVDKKHFYIPKNKFLEHNKWHPNDNFPTDFDKFAPMLDNTVSSSGKTLERTLTMERNFDKKPWKHNKKDLDDIGSRYDSSPS